MPGHATLRAMLCNAVAIWGSRSSPVRPCSGCCPISPGAIAPPAGLHLAAGLGEERGSAFLCNIYVYL
eukprot:8532684-Lingulodinium_polyedra.AAC.1